MVNLFGIPNAELEIMLSDAQRTRDRLLRMTEEAQTFYQDLLREWNSRTTKKVLAETHARLDSQEVKPPPKATKPVMAVDTRPLEPICREHDTNDGRGAIPHFERNCPDVPMKRPVVTVRGNVFDEAWSD